MELIIDNDKYVHEFGTITGKEIRFMAGILDSADLFQLRPGEPDFKIGLEDVALLPARFVSNPRASYLG